MTATPAPEPVGGDPRRGVLVAADPAWAPAFDGLRGQLADAFDPPARIAHVGSTAVRGLPARPVLDALVAVADPDDPTVAATLAGLGFTPATGVGDLRRFEGVAPDGTAADVLVVGTGSPAERAALLFVAFLRTHPVHADSYVHHKDELRLRMGDAPDAGAAAKGSFVAAVLADAERWAAERDWRPEHAFG